MPNRLLARVILAAVLLVTASTAAQDTTAQNTAARNVTSPPFPLAAEHALGAVRGITIGPIESSLHPNKGYGSAPYENTLKEVNHLGGTWVSLTPFGRVWSLESVGIDWRFEAPWQQNAKDIEKAVQQAHARGLKVMLVPHLWVETGGWRGEMNPPDAASWKQWQESYTAFVLHWAEVAERSGVDLFSVGVEMRSWVTTTHAVTFPALVDKVRATYSGPLTYAANWDDAKDTVIWDELDVIGINAFYPLAQSKSAPLAELRRNAEQLATEVEELARGWNKPVLFTEIGYTTRTGAAVDPWEWPDSMSAVVINERAQADAYHALISAFLEKPWFLGFFVWRLYADPEDLSQEALWGFSPRGKAAELVLRDAFSSPFAADGERQPGLFHSRALHVGL